MRKLVILPVALAAAIVSTARAQIIYEGFSYAAGVNTASASNAVSTATTTGLTASASGLSGSYIMNRGGAAQNVSGTSMNSTNLTFGTLPSSGGSLLWSGFGSTASGNGMTVGLDSTAQLSLAPTVANKTIWMSFIFKTSTFASGSGIYLATSNGSGDALPTTTFGLGFNTSGTAAAYYNNGVTASGTNVFSLNTAYWLVGNFTFGSNASTPTFTAANLWVLNTGSGNPPVSEVSLGAAEASFVGSVTAGGSRTPVNLLFRSGSSGAVVNYDEVRVGDTYLSVVPEPSTWALLVIGAATALVLR